MLSKAPGRICIFGEHQDYIGHPVIAGAINLFFNIKGDLREDNNVIINKLDLNEVEKFILPKKGLLEYKKERDYFKSGINVLRKKGYKIDRGVEVEVWSNIPIMAGTSSSSALAVAWIRFLSDIYGLNISDDYQVGEYAYLAEVEEFGEPGGKMDQYTSAVGGIVYLDFIKKDYEKLKKNMSGFVLIDSLTPKDTFGVLKRLKYGETTALKLIKEKYKNIDLSEIDEKQLSFLPSNLFKYGKAAVMNYQLTIKGRSLLREENIDENLLGQYLNEEHKLLRDCLEISTEKIEKILDIALKNGALGGKINGSGGGGTVFFYAPGKEEFIIDKLQKLNIRAFKIKII
jgi:galactokinase